MHLVLTPTQRSLIRSTEEALAGCCPASRVRASIDQRDLPLRATVAELGLLGLTLGEDHGGMGLDHVSSAALVLACGRFALPLPLPEVLALLPTLVELGEAELASAVAAGGATVALADANHAAQDADLAVHTWFVTPGSLCHADDPELTPLSGVDPTQRWFRVSAIRTCLQVDADALWARLQVFQAAFLLGLAEHMLELATSWARTRRQFGAPIGSFQAVQHRLVDALLRQRFARPALWQAAWSLDHAHPETDLHAAMASLHAREAATFTARAALQTHGAIGYAWEHDLHLWMKRAWVMAAGWGGIAGCLETASQQLLSGVHAHAP